MRSSWHASRPVPPERRPSRSRPRSRPSGAGRPEATAPPAAAPVAVEPPAAAAPTGGEAADAVAAQTLRVRLDVLEQLMTLVGELVLTRNQLLQLTRTTDDSVFKTPLQRLSHLTTELQEGVMRTRMQPIGNAWSKLPRLVRDLGLELGKQIELKLVGADTELDRQILELIKDPIDPHGAQLGRPRARVAGRAAPPGQARGGHDPARGVPRRWPHRDPSWATTAAA